MPSLTISNSLLLLILRSAKQSAWHSCQTKEAEECVSVWATLSPGWISMVKELLDLKHGDKIVPDGWSDVELDMILDYVCTE